MRSGVTERLAAWISAGDIAADPAQVAVAERLDGLTRALERSTPAGTRFGGGLFRSGGGRQPKGLYIHGSVGRGKTMLMDLFYEGAPALPKQRQHFHEFMSAVHDRIKRGRDTTEGDPIPFVAAELAGEARLLCLDELQVNDIADAMILGRLFKTLFERGVVLVATSNAAPRDLYPNGLNRQLFLPFIAMLEERLDIMELKSAKDYRLGKLVGRRLYFSPVDDAARFGMDAHWQRLIGHQKPSPARLEVKGRVLEVPEAAMGVARLTFAQACECALGPSDYLALAHAFHTILIDAIPRLGPERRNEARRFITLVDALYDNGVSLIASAEAEPHELYPAGDGAAHFERTVSRLMEMRSEDYLARRIGPACGKSR